MENKISIAIVTHDRERYAIPTAMGLLRNLKSEAYIGYYIADDSGNHESTQRVVDCFNGSGWHCIGIHSEDMTPGTYHCGPSWNLALRQCYEWSDVVLWMEDDWELRQELNVDKFVRLLRTFDKVGMIRLGHMAVGSNLYSVGDGSTHYLQYRRTTQYAYSGNPHLRHKRFVDAYGYFSETLNPGDVELDFDARFRAKEGPEIWWPIELGGWGVFGHLGTHKSFE